MGPGSAGGGNVSACTWLHGAEWAGAIPGGPAMAWASAGAKGSAAF